MEKLYNYMLCFASIHSFMIMSNDTLYINGVWYYNQLRAMTERYYSVGDYDRPIYPVLDMWLYKNTKCGRLIFNDFNDVYVWNGRDYANEGEIE